MDNVGSDDTGGADYSTFNLGATYHFGVVTPAVAFTSAPPVNLASQTSSELVAPWSFSGAPFEFNSSILSADLETALQVPLKRLKAHPNAQLHIRAHSDAQGSMQYNQHLSELRAESVRSYFIGEGITAVRVTAEGAGETKPIASNKTAEGRFKNRRVELFSPALNITSTGEQ
ncbi:Outer membrane porin F precursor [compost metagenome]